VTAGLRDPFAVWKKRKVRVRVVVTLDVYSSSAVDAENEASADAKRALLADDNVESVEVDGAELIEDEELR